MTRDVIINLDLIMDAAGACRGVVAWDLADGTLHVFRSHQTVLATGGYGDVDVADHAESRGGVPDRSLVWNSDLVETLELDNLLGCAMVSIKSAINRPGSAHCAGDPAPSSSSRPVRSRNARRSKVTCSAQ